jgi:siroheme synthase
VGDLKSIADLAILHKVQAPSTIVVGGVVNVLLDKDEETGATVQGLIQNMKESATAP